MLRNYIRVAWRNLQRNTAFSVINILGLTIGVAACLLIALYVQDELSYDRYHVNAQRIYRINSDIKFGGKEMDLAVAPDPMGFTMVHDYPQVENAVRFREQGSFLVRRNDKASKDNQTIKETRGIFADSSLFSVFTLPMQAGNPKTALTEPFSVVVTESMAQKYFHSTDVLGKTLLLDNSKVFKITGVIEDMPSNGHFRYDFFLSMAGLEESKQNNWGSHNFNTYLLLKEGTDPRQLESRFETMMQTYLSPWTKKVMNTTLEELRKSGNNIRYTLIPLTDIHLHSNRIAELAPNSHIQYVYIFSAIAFFLLLIACINFMNLSTARSGKRAKEVGVRKALGSEKSSIISQFLTESVLLTVFAYLMAICLVIAALPLFNDVANKTLSAAVLINPWTIGLILLSIGVVGLLAGSYPAFFLSHFKPIQVLRGNLQSGKRSSPLRNTLVVFQFFASVFLIICTIFIYRQLHYIQNRQLGFNKDQVLLIQDAYALGTQTDAFRNEVLRMPEVKNVTMSGYLPVDSYRSDNTFFPEGEMDQEKAVAMQNWRVDTEYIPTMGMQMIAGRNFSKNFLTDSSAMILNETAVRLFGFQNPIGKKVFKMEDVKTGQMRVFTVVGVVKDFNYESLRNNVGALCMQLSQSKGFFCVRLQSDDYPAIISQIHSTWKKIAGNQPFAYSFMDENFDNMYRSEQRVGKLFVSFAVLAICIACLGLFGLSAYTAEQRTKEIGIRKVLGATESQLIVLLSKDFLKLVGIAFVVAVPVAWYAMQQWLADFAYRIDLSWPVFVLAGLLALCIALLTVSMQAIKAALANPVKSLRTE